MSEAEAAPESTEKTITIKVTDNTMNYETDMSLTEMIFWMEAIKATAIQSVTNQE